MKPRGVHFVLYPSSLFTRVTVREPPTTKSELLKEAPVRSAREALLLYTFCLIHIENV